MLIPALTRMVAPIAPLVTQRAIHDIAGTKSKKPTTFLGYILLYGEGNKYQGNHFKDIEDVRKIATLKNIPYARVEQTDDKEEIITKIYNDSVRNKNLLF